MLRHNTCPFPRGSGGSLIMNLRLALVSVAVVLAPAMALAQAGAAGAPAQAPSTGQCASARPLGNLLEGAVWNGWGVDATNSRFQSEKAAGLRAQDVPRLKLKWAFGFPNANSAFAQPTL